MPCRRRSSPPQLLTEEVNCQDAQLGSVGPHPARLRCLQRQQPRIELVLPTTFERRDQFGAWCLSTQRRKGTKAQRVASSSIFASWRLRVFALGLSDETAFGFWAAPGLWGQNPPTFSAAGRWSSVTAEGAWRHRLLGATAPDCSTEAKADRESGAGPPLPV